MTLKKQFSLPSAYIILNHMYKYFRFAKRCI